ncbi:dihydroneopterin aldolase [Bacillus sp. S/N-304-OC-R1]|uniref:dihydroneopterin aldolase n=1 Tax=Bacillus sp. S/N-304-OC-R1 TaxID=2758034 RepID=UPI001C8D2491|nr:dihydroneopterin aldolase [Bacillus sp. S/N-304-OC-R1]MBY0124435.1 dihydroneopterin aldolase [Bacillus sp. S/N-304-OC-R1]
MDKITLNKMAFYGYHGVFQEETRLGQRFFVDLTVETDLKKAGQTDHLEDSINYAELYQVCKEIVEGKPFKLVEAVAEKIAGEMLNRFKTISQVTVRVVKPDPPIPGHYESVAVEITRSRG